MSPIDRRYAVLFLCGANTSRGLMAESVLRGLADDQFAAYSAGVTPAYAVHPLTLETLADAGYPTDGLHSKSVAAFEGRLAPRIDFIITLCDDLTGEDGPVVSGQAPTAHWPVPEPADQPDGSPQQRRAFQSVLALVSTRMRVLAKTPLAGMDLISLRHRLAEIAAVDQAGA